MLNSTKMTMTWPQVMSSKQMEVIGYKIPFFLSYMSLVHVTHKSVDLIWVWQLHSCSQGP